MNEIEPLTPGTVAFRRNEPEPDQSDALTGLWSRVSLLKLISRTTAVECASVAVPALLVLDLDRFKVVNDSAGTASGDAVLCRVARRIESAVPEGSSVARINGDEFAVLLTDAGQAGEVAAKLLDLISRPYLVNGHALTIGVSIGIAPFLGGDQDAGGLLQAANIALHHAQADGKGRWYSFEPWMQEVVVSRQRLEMDLRAAVTVNRAELRTAMSNEQFELHYQPQVDADTLRPIGFEALCRWRHPLRGTVGPDQFIPLAEDIGLIGLLGDWVLRTACIAAAGWPAAPNGQPYRVAVNVSPLQLREKRALVASVADALDRSGLAPERLEIEITESALISDALETLQGIKALGVSLSLDDFGTGYSSLSQLARYPFDRLKIDRAFVRELVPGDEVDLASAARARWMLRAIVSMGAALDLSTVAEGVETEAQADIVRQAGVNVIQGYLIAHPTPESELTRLMLRLEASTEWSLPVTPRAKVG